MTRYGSGQVQYSVYVCVGVGGSANKGRVAWTFPDFVLRRAMFCYCCCCVDVSVWSPSMRSLSVSIAHTHKSCSSYLADGLNLASFLFTHQAWLECSCGVKCKDCSYFYCIKLLM